MIEGVSVQRPKPPSPSVTLFRSMNDTFSHRRSWTRIDTTRVDAKSVKLEVTHSDGIRTVASPAVIVAVDDLRELVRQCADLCAELPDAA